MFLCFRHFAWIPNCEGTSAWRYTESDTTTTNQQVAERALISLPFFLSLFPDSIWPSFKWKSNRRDKCNRKKVIHEANRKISVEFQVIVVIRTLRSAVIYTKPRQLAFGIEPALLITLLATYFVTPEKGRTDIFCCLFFLFFFLFCLFARLLVFFVFFCFFWIVDDRYPLSIILIVGYFGELWFCFPCLSVCSF